MEGVRGFVKGQSGDGADPLKIGLELGKAVVFNGLGQTPAETRDYACFVHLQSLPMNGEEYVRDRGIKTLRGRLTRLLPGGVL